MFAGIVDVVAAAVATAVIMLLPGMALIGAFRLQRIIDAPLLPAAWVAGSLLVTAPSLVAVLALHGSMSMFALIYAVSTLVLGIGAVARLSVRATQSASEWREEETTLLASRLRRGLPYAVPAAVLSVVTFIDSPHVRSDTYWHVALSRKLAWMDQLSSKRIAFEAGAAGNANYPLPTFHALVGLADHVPHVTLWSATWFLTIWMSWVAMLAFGGMSAALLGDRRAVLVGCWTFVGVVVLGYGPWYFATRYLSYAGQIAIYLLLPIAVVSLVRVLTTDGTRRRAHVAIAAVLTAEIGMLHGNYVLYPILFAWGAFVLLVLARRDAWRSAGAATAAVTLAGVAALGAQLPWITNDDNFLRGSSDPTGEPTAFERHRDAFVGTAHNYHVKLGYLDSQPWLLIGALAIPVALLLLRRRPGPWVLAGGAAAIVVFGSVPQLIQLIDSLGSVTPATRFDRVYPAAVGVVAALLGGAWAIRDLWNRRGMMVAASAAGLAAVALVSLTWWMDSIRDTRRIVVTPFVEARWVGGLDPMGAPRLAIIAATIATFVVVAYVAVRAHDRALRERWLEDGDTRWGAWGSVPPLSAIAAVFGVAIVVGLAPATATRLHQSWRPEAYDHSLRTDHTYSRLEVYPYQTRRVIDTMKPGTTVLAAFNDTRRIASLAPVYSVEESRLRQLNDSPPASGAPAATVLRDLVSEWDVRYVAANRFDKPFRPLLAAAAADPTHYRKLADGYLTVYEVRRPGVATGRR